jgi:TonB family protein
MKAKFWIVIALSCLVSGAIRPSLAGSGAEGLLRDAQAAFDRSDYAGAASSYQDAIAAAEGGAPDRLATALEGLARTFVKQGKYLEAGAIYQRALSIREQSQGPNSPAVAKTISEMAAAQRSAGNGEQAEALLRRLQSIGQPTSSMDSSEGSDKPHEQKERQDADASELRRRKEREDAEAREAGAAQRRLQERQEAEAQERKRKEQLQSAGLATSNRHRSEESKPPREYVATSNRHGSEESKPPQEDIFEQSGQEDKKDKKRDELPDHKNDDKKDDKKDGKDVDFGPYMADLQRRIKKQWYPPRGLETRRVVVIFKVRRDGDMRNLKIDKSSEIPAADAAALQAVESASPFRPLPAGSPKEVDIQFTFDYNVFHKGEHKSDEE